MISWKSIIWIDSSVEIQKATPNRVALNLIIYDLTNNNLKKNVFYFAGKKYGAALYIPNLG